MYMDYVLYTCTVVNDIRLFRDTGIVFLGIHVFDKCLTNIILPVLTVQAFLSSCPPVSLFCLLRNSVSRPFAVESPPLGATSHIGLVQAETI
jgi:hypothetical protein